MEVTRIYPPEYIAARENLERLLDAEADCVRRDLHGWESRNIHDPRDRDRILKESRERTAPIYEALARLEAVTLPSFDISQGEKVHRQDS